MLKLMRKHTKVIMAVVIAFFVLSIFAGYGMYSRSGSGGERDYAVAKIDGRKVMRSAVDSAMVRIAEQMRMTEITSADWLNLRHAALDSMAVQSQLEKEIKNRKIEINKDEIESAYVNLMDSYPTREAFKEFLNNSGLKEQSVKNDIKNQLRREKVVQALISEIAVRKEDAENFYEMVKDFRYKRGKGYMMNIATFSSKETAGKVQAAITGGAGWDAVLEEHKDELMASTPYDKPGEMAEGQMQGTLQGLKVLSLNKVSPVVDIAENEFAVVIKRSNTEERILPFEEVSQDVTAVLRNQQSEKIFIDLRGKATVEILDPSVFPGGETQQGVQPEVSPDAK